MRRNGNTCTFRPLICERSTKEVTVSRYEERTLAKSQEAVRLPPCPVGRAGTCTAAPALSLPLTTYDRWERAIARLQGVVACSPDCPLADHLLGVIAAMGKTANPLAEVCPELDPAPNKPRRWTAARAA